MCWGQGHPSSPWWSLCVCVCVLLLTWSTVTGRRWSVESVPLFQFMPDVPAVRLCPTPPREEEL